MAYTYADWITQADNATRLTRLRLHIQEVSEAMTAGMTADGVSVNPSNLGQYYDMLTKREESLGASNSNNMVTRVRVRGL